MCDGYTVPMPVSGGCPAFVTITGVAFAPIAVTGGVSILACRDRERERMKEGVVQKHKAHHFVIKTSQHRLKMRMKNKRCATDAQ